MSRNVALPDLTFREQVVGISDLHRLGIVHHDLKPENILIDADGHCVIVDYGGAKFMNDENLVSLKIEDDVLCTLNYTAPELLSEYSDTKGIKWYDCSVDWWALGAVIMSLTTGKVGARCVPKHECPANDEVRVGILRSRLNDGSLGDDAVLRQRHPGHAARAWLLRRADRSCRGCKCTEHA